MYATHHLRLNSLLVSRQKKKKKKKRSIVAECLGNNFCHANHTIGIKHGLSCINIRQVPREVLKTEAGGRGFQHLPRDLANVNALKNHDRSLLLHKN